MSQQEEKIMRFYREPTGQEARNDEREALIAAARTSIADADRCVALHVTPSTGTLHRRLREVTRALADAHTELAARKHPEPEITETAAVDRALAALMASPGVPTGVRPHLLGGEVLVIRERVDAEDVVRVVLAALRVPVGEGEQ